MDFSLYFFQEEEIWIYELILVHKKGLKLENKIYNEINKIKNLKQLLSQ